MHFEHSFAAPNENMHVYALKGGIHALTWYCFALRDIFIMSYYIEKVQY